MTESTVFIVDDDPGVRFSLSLLMETAELKSASFSSAEEFLAACGPRPIGCLLLDVSMPGLTGPQLQDELVKRKINLPIIFLTGYADMSTVVSAMRQGAVDFLAKPANGTVLLELVQSTLERHRIHRKAEDARDHFARRLRKLTAREREILVYAISGNSNKEISTKLKISMRTIEGHRARIHLKMDVRSLLELAQQAALANVSLTDLHVEIRA